MTQRVFKTSADARRRAKEHYHANKIAINHKRRTDPVYVRNNKSRALVFRTGVDLETKERMIKEQGGRCGACHDILGEGTRQRCLDHDHKTNKARAVLCNQFNIALGMVQDSVDRLNNLVLYLQLHT